MSSPTDTRTASPHAWPEHESAPSMRALPNTGWAPSSADARPGPDPVVQQMISRELAQHPAVLHVQPVHQQRQQQLEQLAADMQHLSPPRPATQMPVVAAAPVVNRVRPMRRRDGVVGVVLGLALITATIGGAFGLNRLSQPPAITAPAAQIAPAAGTPAPAGDPAYATDAGSTDALSGATTGATADAPAGTTDAATSAARAVTPRSGARTTSDGARPRTTIPARSTGTRPNAPAAPSSGAKPARAAAGGGNARPAHGGSGSGHGTSVPAAATTSNAAASATVSGGGAQPAAAEPAATADTGAAAPAIQPTTRTPVSYSVSTPGGASWVSPVSDYQAVVAVPNATVTPNY